MAKNELPMSDWSNTQLTLLAILAILFGGC
jgi:hypothetical protein